MYCALFRPFVFLSNLSLRLSLLPWYLPASHSTVPSVLPHPRHFMPGYHLFSFWISYRIRSFFFSFSFASVLALFTLTILLLVFLFFSLIDSSFFLLLTPSSFSWQVQVELELKNIHHAYNLFIYTYRLFFSCLSPCLCSIYHSVLYTCLWCSSLPLIRLHIHICEHPYLNTRKVEILA